MTYTIEEYHRAVYRNAFLPFLVRSFGVLHEEETTPFIPNWHTEAMANVIEQIALGGRTRQIMEVPPRYLKSICTSVAGTAWMLGRNPSMKILVASYGADLAGKHARDTNKLMTSSFYSDVFPNVKITLEQGARNRNQPGRRT